jgi:hypothetical protein
MALYPFALGQPRLRAKSNLDSRVEPGVSLTSSPHVRTRASRDTFPRSASQPRTMQPEESTSASGADSHADQPAAEQISTTITASNQRITKQFLAANAALLA